MTEFRQSIERKIKRRIDKQTLQTLGEIKAIPFQALLIENSFVEIIFITV